MPESVYRQNMTFLKSKFLDFYKNLTNPSLTIPTFNINESEREGNYQISYNGIKCTLHSAFDIDREMDMLFRPLTGEDNQVIVIFGLGYGHCIDYIRKRHIKYKRIIIFEPCTNILQEVLKKRPVLDLLGMNNLYLHLMNLPNDMAKSLLQEAMESKTVKILYHVSYMSLFGEIFDNVLRSFKNERISMETSINTMRAKATEWNTQQLKSIQMNYRSASALAGKFKGVPAIVASAGPSLEKHFGLLEEIGDRAVIVAPGSSTRIFNARGLKAHIAMSIDSNVIQAGFYKDYTMDNILVASYRLHPDVYKNFPNDVLLAALSTEFIARYYYDWMGQKPFMIDDHSSVSVAAIDMLLLMGCNPVILIGQDLSYQENRNYADAKTDTLSNFQKQNSIEDTDIYGNKVYTYYGYKAVQNDIEVTAIRYRDMIKIYNATEGGLNIHGIENALFSDLYDRHIKSREYDVHDRLKEAMDNDINVNKKSGGRDAGLEPDSKTVDNFFGHLIDACGDVEKLVGEKESGFIALEKLIQRGVSSNRINDEMKYIQSYNKRLDEIPFFKQVVFPNIDSSLAFIHAGGKHIADSGEDWEGAAMYEHKLDEYALDYINILRAIILREQSESLVGGALR